MFTTFSHVTLMLTARFHEWGGTLAGTLVYRQDPDLVGQNMGPELVAGYAGRFSAAES